MNKMKALIKGLIVSAVQIKRPVFWIWVFIGLSVSLTTSAEQKTLTRVDDPLIVQGKILDALSSVRLDRLSLMACDGDAFQPVPFQVDEKDPAGEYVYTHGPIAGVDTDPNLDANDELVFIVESAGPRCDDRPWPEGASSGVRIEVTDPIDRGQGWLYLFAFEGNPPRSPLDLVSREHTPERTITKARGYMWGSPAEKGYPDELHLAGTDGRLGPDILDKWKSRGKIDLPLINFEIKSDDNTYRNTVGWIDGPVRVIVCDNSYMKISFIKFDFPTNVMLFYYPNSCVFPMTLTIENTNVMKIISKVVEMNFVSVLDYNEHSYGIHSFDPVNGYNPQVVFDGKMSDAEKALDTTKDLEWIAGYRPGAGSVLVRFYLPKEFKGITKSLYYLEDASVLDPPEHYPGMIAHGFQYKLNLESIKKGTYLLYTQFYFKPGLVPGKEKMLLDIFDHPLEVKAASLDKVQ